MTRKGPWKGNYFLHAPRRYYSGLYSDVLQSRCSILRTYFQITLRGIPVVEAVCFTLYTVSILRRVRATSVAVEKHLVFWVCVCSLRYPACNAHAPYCHLWPVRLYSIFPHYLINSASFETKKLLNTKCVFWFSVQLLSEAFLIVRSTERDVIKMFVGLHVKCGLLLSDFNLKKKTWIFLTVFRKILKRIIS